VRGVMTLAVRRGTALDLSEHGRYNFVPLR
jgi:hypothetical protein